MTTSTLNRISVPQLVLFVFCLSPWLVAQSVDPDAVLLFEEDFESGALSDDWVIEGGGDSRARILLVDGSRQLVLDDSQDDDTFSQARATIEREGGDYGALLISFEATNHNDEFQVSAQGLDLVDFLETNSPAATFRLHDYLPSDGNKVRIEYELRLPGGYSSSFGFRLWQYGSKPFPDDGWSFDNFKVYGVPARSEEIELPSPSAADFDIDLRRATVPQTPFSLGDGEYLVFGDFDRVNGEPSDSIAIANAQGIFRSLGTDLGLMSVRVLDSVRNTDGSLTILFRYLGEQGADRIAVVAQDGSLLSLTDAIAGTLLLLPDSRFVSVELGTYKNALGFPRDRFRLRFKRREANGTIVTEAFASEWVTGVFWSLHRLADGSFLAMGDLYNESESKHGQLVRFNPNGELNANFGRYAYLSEDGNSYDRDVFSLASGELFVYNRYGNDGLRKIRSDGTVDTSFELDAALEEGWSMTLTAGPGDKLYLLGAMKSGGNSYPSLYRLNSDGSIDQGFEFSGDAISSQYGGFFWLPLAREGGIVISDSDTMGIGLFEVDGEGRSQFRESSPFASRVSPELKWLPTGEVLLLHSGQQGENLVSIVRADGSFRLEGVEFDASRSLMALPEGGFALPNGERFDESLNPLSFLVMPPYTELVEVLPDGGFLARWHEDRFGTGEAFVKLRVDGSLDSDFPKLSSRSQFLDINGEFIYYTVGDSLGGADATLRRISLDGVEDEGFAFVPEGVSLERMVATSTHLYFARDDSAPGVYLKNWRGIKMSFDGEVDESYDPNSQFSIGGGIYSVFLADGSSIQSGSLVDQVDSQGRSSLYFVDSKGVVSPLDPSTHWESPSIQVFGYFDILVSGIAHTASSGSTRMTKRYRRDVVGFSVPRTTYVAWPENEDIEIDASVYAVDGTDLQWLRNGAPLVGQTQSRLVLPAGTTGNFELVATVDGVARSGPLVQVVPARKPEFVLQPKSSESLFGSTVRLEARVDLSLDAELQWYLNDLALEGETSPFLALPDLEVGALGSYKVRARNAVGDSWSHTAIVTGEGPIPAVKSSLELVKHLNLSARKIIPRADGLAWLAYEDLEYTPYQSSFTNYRLIDANGIVGEDYVGKVERETGEDLVICPLSGTPYLISAESLNNEGIKRHSIKWLDLDGSIDEEFGALVLDGEWGSEVELWRRADGVLLVRLGQDAFARQLDGSVVDYPLDELETFLMRFQRRNISWGQEFLGVWEDGSELELLTDDQVLRAKSQDGSTLWTFPLGDFYMSSIFVEDFGLVGFDYARSRTNESGNRIYVRIHESSTHGSPYRIAWFEKDGNNNLDEAKSWPGELHCQAFSLSANGDIFVGGLEKSGEGGERVFAVRVMYEGDSLSESVQQFSPSPVQSVQLHGSGSDEWLYLSHDGDALAEGLMVGPLVRIDGRGELDRRFQTSESIPLGSDIEVVSTLSNNGVVLVTKLGGQYWVHVLSSEGEALTELTLADRSNMPEIEAGPEGSWFMLETSSGARLLRRFDASGAMDADFGIVFLNANSHLVGVDSSKRPYFIDIDSGGNLCVLRRANDGTADNAYGIDTGVSSLRLLAALDREDRLLRMKLDGNGDLVLERYLSNGLLDPSFNAVTVDQEQADDLRPLFGGYILLGNSVYTNNGNFHFNLASYYADWRQKLGAEETLGGFADAKILSGLDGVAVTKWLLADGLDLRYKTQYPRWSESGKATLAVDLASFEDAPLHWRLNGETIPNVSAKSLQISSPARGSEVRYEAVLNLGSLEIPLLDLQVVEIWAPLITLSFENGAIKASWPWSEEGKWALQAYSSQVGWLDVDAELWNDDDGQKSFEFSASESEMPLMVRLRSL